MNPYVYKKARKAVAPQPGPLDAAAHLFNSIIHAQVGTGIALAAIIFAAGSTMAVTALASAEIGGGSDAPVAHSVAFRSSGYVLGDSTVAPDAPVIDDSSLEATTTLASVKLSAKAKSYDSTIGRWDYRIYYSSKRLGGAGSITIGTYVVANGLTQNSGSVETGAILKPSTVYQVTFWVAGSIGNQYPAGRTEIKTRKGKSATSNSALISLCQNQTSASSTPPSAGLASSTVGSMFCLKTDDGKVVCPRPSICGPMNHEGGNASGTPPNWPPKPEDDNASGTPLGHTQTQDGPRGDYQPGQNQQGQGTQ